MKQSKFHTLDRHNWRAQRDPKCCLDAEKSDQWRFAVDQWFNITHWPLIQDRVNYLCVRSFFSDSYDSLVLAFGINRYTMASTAVMALIAYYVV